MTENTQQLTKARTRAFLTDMLTESGLPGETAADMAMSVSPKGAMATLQAAVAKGAAAQAAIDEMGYGEVQVVKPMTIYLAMQGVDHEGYTQIIGARTTADAARVLATEHAGALADQLKPWRQYGSGTLMARLGEGNEYYAVMALPVTA